MGGKKLAKIKAKKIPVKTESAEDILCRFCYYFPQYTYNQAKDLPYKRVSKMLKVAEKVKAQDRLLLTSIVSAPHTKKGSGVKKLVDYFRDIIDG